MKRVIFYIFFFFLIASPVVARSDGTITGRVVNEGGNPVGGATVQAFIPGYEVNLSTTTGSDGSFNIPVSLYSSEYTYTIVVSADGYNNNGDTLATISPTTPEVDVGVITLTVGGSTPDGTSDPVTPPSSTMYQPPSPSGLDCRPNACDACNQTSLMTGSCATSFTVNDQISYKKKDGALCPYDNQHWVEGSWGGPITINPSSTTIPFVGKEGMENERRYLADYFEGTDKYYAFYDDPIQAVMHSGVWRKLAPQSLQNDYKRKMIQERISCGNEGNVHDYVVRSSTGESETLSVIAGHMPPLQTDDNYLVNYNVWKESENGKWYRLWQSVPMFSREDTEGNITAYVATKRLDQVSPPVLSQIEKVPHVARLYDATKAINTLLTPYSSDATSAYNQQNSYLASTETFSPNQKTLLAQSSYDCSHPFSMSIENVSYENGQINYGLRLFLNAEDGQQCHLTLNGNYTGGCIWPPSSYFQAGASSGTVNPVSASDNGTFYISASAGLDMHHPCGVVGLSDSCAVTIESGVIINTTCGVSVPPPPPTCDLPPASGVDACVREAIRDTNPNDGLCCQPMSMTLSAKDRTVNPYAPCTAVTIPPGCGDCVDTDDDGEDDWCCRPTIEGCVLNEWGVSVCRSLPPNSCDENVRVDVYRDVAVQLSHPYLSEIWDYSSSEETGFFNIFRPESEENFKDLDAASDIYYSYTPGSVDKSTGSFYYPHLGGVQKAREWVVRSLYPYPLATADYNQIGYTPSTPPSGQPSGDLQQMLDAAAVASGVDAKFLAAILAIESPTHFNNPASTYCPVSECGATGPFQIVTGWENVNCDPAEGNICVNYCENGAVPLASRNLFNTWASYSSPGMNPCNLADALVVAAQIFKAKAGGSVDLSDNPGNIERIVRGAMSYHGNQYNNSQDAAWNCHNVGTKYPRLGNRTYCEYVFWHAGIESLIN